MRVLVFVGYYLPGYKGGGPLRTIVNLVQHLGDDIDFWIVTRDRDLGDSSAYKNIIVDEWQMVGRAHVCYLSPDKLTVLDLRRLMASTQYDVLYLNSFFDFELTIKPLLARLLFGATKAPVIVAPRGEFSGGALSLKRFKKSVYIAVSKLLGIYRNVCFQASSLYEASDIASALGIPVEKIKVAMDLPEKESDQSFVDQERAPVDLASEKLKVIFLSRISPMKNLTFALDVLRNVKKVVQFDIYGPIEDRNYWAACEALILRMPNNVKVEYRGAINPSDVRITFAQYDLCFLPTLGENYGHVIAESLGVGTQVLISDKTPWRNLRDVGLGWDLPLSHPGLFVDTIEKLANLKLERRVEQRAIVKANALRVLFDPAVVSANKDLFESQLSYRSGS